LLTLLADAHTAFPHARDGALPADENGTQDCKSRSYRFRPTRVAITSRWELTAMQFYMPWKRTEYQDDLIQDQIRDAEDSVEKEVREFKQSKEQRLRALGVSTVKEAPEPESEPLAPPSTHAPAPEPEDARPGEDPEPEQTVGKSDNAAEPLPDLSASPPHPPQPETTNPPVSSPSAQANKVGEQSQPEKESDDAGDAGDVMVEESGITVIY
jgi:hypothetical protein